MSQQILLVAQAKGNRLHTLKEGLKLLGYPVVAMLPSDSKLDMHLSMPHEKIVVIIHSLVCDDETISLLSSIQQRAPKPVVLFVDSSTEQQAINAVNAGANAYVVDGLQTHRLKSLIDLAVARFQRCMGMRQELNDTKQKLSERKTIDRARGILMKNKNISEDEAYQLLRNMAMDRHQRVGVFSQSVIDAAELLG